MMISNTILNLCQTGNISITRENYLKKCIHKNSWSSSYKVVLWNLFLLLLLLLEFVFFIEVPAVVWKQQSVGVIGLPLPWWTGNPFWVNNSVNGEFTTSQGSFGWTTLNKSKCKISSHRRTKDAHLQKESIIANSPKQRRQQ